jgi:tripartite-type tricarboxylate transporter receptor subunit TctC
VRSLGGDAMEIVRRRFLGLTAAAVGASALSSIAGAQAYPARPVRLIVGFTAAQAIDILARLIGHWLSDRLGQQFVVENRPGAGGNIAAEAVVRAAPDGYTLLVIGGNNAINATLYDNLSFDVLRDLVPIAGVYRVSQVMVVNPKFAARTVPDFIAYAQANPSKINFGSAGNGSVAHVTGELFKMMTGIQMQHVPYRGGPQALTDLMGGQVDVMFDNIPSSIEHIRAGRLRPLAVTSTKQLDVLPGIPTVDQSVPGFETSAFAGLGAPRGTPADIIKLLNREVNAGLADAVVKARIADLGGVPLPVSPSEFGQFLADETEKWRKAVKFSGARPN